MKIELRERTAGHVRVYFEAPARWIAAQAASVLGALLLALCLAGMRGRRRPS